MQRTLKSLLSLAMVTPLFGCGGGGSSDVPDNSSVPDGFVRFSGRIGDAAGNPITDADVSVPFGKGQAWAGHTGATGQYSFVVRVADFAGVSPVAMVVQKAGYRPTSYQYRSVVAGAEYTLQTDAANSPRVLQANEAVPEGLASLVHIGDSNFSGAANSQLQTATIGSAVGYKLLTWTTDYKSKYRTATIEFMARGIQTTNCPSNRFSINAVLGNAGYAGAVQPADSDPNGGFTKYRLNVDVSRFPVGSAVDFGASSGDCTAGVTGKDDFEFADVVVVFS